MRNEYELWCGIIKNKAMERSHEVNCTQEHILFPDYLRKCHFHLSRLSNEKRTAKVELWKKGQKKELE